MWSHKSLAEGAVVVDVGVPVWRPDGAAGTVDDLRGRPGEPAAAAERLSP